MGWILKSFDTRLWSAGSTAKSITAAVTATPMTIAITIHRAPLFGAAVVAPPDDCAASILTPTPGIRCPSLKILKTTARAVETFLRGTRPTRPRASSRSVGGAMAVPFHTVHHRCGDCSGRRVRDVVLLPREVAKEARYPGCTARPARRAHGR